MTVDVSKPAPGDADGTSSAGPSCALCGFAPTGDDEALRQLGEPPVVVLVCADQVACVRRFEGVSARAS
jgi:hypothetical protein